MPSHEDGLVVDYLYHEGILDENLNRENAESFAKYKDKMDFLKVRPQFFLVFFFSFA